MLMAGGRLQHRCPPTLPAGLGRGMLGGGQGTVSHPSQTRCCQSTGCPGQAPEQEVGAELVSALAGRGARRTAPALTFWSLSPGSHRTPGSGLIPAEESGDVSVLCSPAFSKGLGQRSGCFKNKAWSLQRLCCWSDKADSPSVVAGSHGAANHMVELGGRRSWAPCSSTDPGNSSCKSPRAPCAGWPARGACTSLPRGQPSSRSRPPEHGRWLSLRRDDGL